MDPLELLEVLAEKRVAPWPEFINLLSDRQPAFCPGFNTVIPHNAHQRDIFKALHHQIDVSGHDNIVPFTRDASVPKVKLTVLVTNDSPINQRVIQTILENASHRVITANYGEQAMDFVSDEMKAMDLAVLDVAMPVYSGIEVIKTIRHNVLSVIARTARISLTINSAGSRTMPKEPRPPASDTAASSARATPPIPADRIG